MKKTSKNCEMDSCSVFPDSRSCESSCGFGSHGKCAWRASTFASKSIPGNVLAPNNHQVNVTCACSHSLAYNEMSKLAGGVVHCNITP